MYLFVVIVLDMRMVISHERRTKVIDPHQIIFSGHLKRYNGFYNYTLVQKEKIPQLNYSKQVEGSISP